VRKIQFPAHICQEFERIASEHKIYLEGNILKVIEPVSYEKFNEYIDLAKENDANNRKKRLEVTKQVQEQNKQLTKSHEQKEQLMEELKTALAKAEEANKSVAEQNEKLIETQSENEKLMTDLKDALGKAENAKKVAENDLDLIQKRTQFELIGNIVSYALYVIVGTGIITTALYVMAMLYGSTETTLIGNTWSNLFGILLTNSFSIIGTIMGVKYASKDDTKKS
jgi:flagellar motility protein MotE (MotC chaperone)